MYMDVGDIDLDLDLDIDIVIIDICLYMCLLSYEPQRR